jgi:SAM-dependent methyltransferase
VAFAPEPVAAASAPVFHQNRYAQALGDLVSDGCAWLDVGAGTKLHDGWIGPSCEELAARAAYLAGCDVVEAVRHHPHLHDARVADASRLPWPDMSFDVVSANMVVEHLTEPDAVFTEIRRVLKPGGHFVFVTPNRWHPIIGTASIVLPPSARRWYAVHVEGRAAADVFVTCYRCNTVPAVRRLARTAGLEPTVVETFASSAPLLPGLAGRAEMGLTRLAARGRIGRALGTNLLAVLTRSESPAD